MICLPSMTDQTSCCVDDGLESVKKPTWSHNLRLGAGKNNMVAGGLLCLVATHVCLSVCGSVRPSKWSVLPRIKIKMFLGGPAIVPLHFYLERSKGKVKDAQMPKSFFGRNICRMLSDLLQLQTTIVQFRGQIMLAVLRIADDVVVVVVAAAAVAAAAVVVFRRPSEKLNSLTFMY